MQRNLIVVTTIITSIGIIAGVALLQKRKADRRRVKQVHVSNRIDHLCVDISKQMLFVTGVHGLTKISIRDLALVRSYSASRPIMYSECALGPSGVLTATTGDPSQLLSFDRDLGKMSISVHEMCRPQSIIANDLTWAVACCDGTICCWSAKDSNPIWTAVHPGSRPACIWYSLDDSAVWSVGLDLNIVEWDIKSGRALHSAKGQSGHYYNMCIAPKADCIVLGGGNGVYVWKYTQTDKPTLFESSAIVYRIAISQDGKWIAWSSWPGTEAKIVSIDKATTRMVTKEMLGGQKLIELMFTDQEGRVAFATESGNVGLVGLENE